MEGWSGLRPEFLGDPEPVPSFSGDVSSPLIRGDQGSSCFDIPSSLSADNHHGGRV